MASLGSTMTTLGRRLAAVLGVGIVVAACGGATAPQPTPTATAAATATATPGPRVVKHAMGETTVAASPQRVVTLDLGELEAVLALGLKPAGAATSGTEFQDHIKDKVAGVQKVGNLTQPNLEAIAALKPDLILGSKQRLEKVYPQLAQIAPTVFSESIGGTWKENIKLYGEALGKEKEAEKLLSDYQKRTSDLKTKLGAKASATQVSFLRGRPTEIRIYMKANFVGQILQDAGLPRPPAQNKDVPIETATKERVADMDGDVIFIAFDNDKQTGLLADLMKEPAWQALKGVKAGRVHIVPSDIWVGGVGVIGANIVLDDLFKYLAS